MTASGLTIGSCIHMLNSDRYYAEEKPADLMERVESEILELTAFNQGDHFWIGWCLKLSGVFVKSGSSNLS